MSDEISLSMSLNVKNGGAKYAISQSFNATMTGHSWATGVLDLVNGVAKELVTQGDLDKYGWVFLHITNGMTSEYADFSHDSAVGDDDVICRVMAGKSALFYTADIDELHAKATAATAGTLYLEYAILEV